MLLQLKQLLTPDEVAQARQLLVVPGKAPRQAGGESRAFVRGSASLGTWLGALNRLMKD